MVAFAVELRGAVAWVRYQHAPRNFLTARALVELAALMRRLERDDGVRVIVLGGQGADFMLHLEVGELGALVGQLPRLPGLVLRALLAAARAAAWLCGRWPRLGALLLGRSERAVLRSALIHMMVAFAAVQRSSKVTIAAINGSCVGGGLELALCCDYRLMADAAGARIGLPEILIGLVPGFGGSQRLLRAVGPQRALELLLAGELLGAREAAAAGVVSRALPPERFAAEVDALAARLARRPPAAVAAMKRLVRRGAALPLGAALALEQREVARLSWTAGARAGLREYAARVTVELGRPVGEQRTLAELALAMDRER